MNKITIAAAIFILLVVTAKSQDTVYLRQKNKTLKGTEKTIVTDRPPQAFYAELYGRGLLFSLNYDRRFNKTLDGLGFSVGVGGFSVDDFTLLTVPVSLNYLVGNNGHYFEAGVGTTFASAKITDDLGDGSNGGGSTWLGTITLGYRSQPAHGGLNFRAGLNFLVGNSVFLPWPYVGLGYNF